MTRGHFLVGFKDTICSEKNLEIESLLKKETNIDEDIKISCPGEIGIMKLKTDVGSFGVLLDTPILSPNKRGVVAYIAGYIAKKYLKNMKRSSCCKMHITGFIDKEELDHEYLIILNQRGLTIPSPNLVN